MGGGFKQYDKVYLRNTKNPTVISDSWIFFSIKYTTKSYFINTKYTANIKHTNAAK